MAGNDSDIFVIITLWLLYIGIHVCMDFFERRARRSADEMAEHEARTRAPGIFAEVIHGEGAGNGHDPRRALGREIHVVVLASEPNAEAMASGTPCDGALVPDANGQVPQLPEPVHYGEASYAAPEKGADVDAAPITS